MLCKRGILFLGMIILISSLSFASSDFSVIIKPAKNVIMINETAEFELLIKNSLDSGQRFRIYSLDYNWDLFTKPYVNPITMDLARKEEGSTFIFIRPLHIEKIGTYEFPINVKNTATDEVVKTPIRITIMSSDQIIGDYVPTVLTKVDMDKQINPNEKISVKIHLNNQNILNIENLIIELESNLIKDSIEQTIGPKEKKTVEFTTQIASTTMPQKDTLSITIKRGNQTIEGPIIKDFEIIGYSEITQDKIEKYGFFSKRTEILFKNIGNDAFTGSLKTKRSFFKRMFISSSPKATIEKEDNIDTYVWQATIPAGQETKVMLVENYKMLFFIIVIILAIIFSYYYLRSPIILTKKSSSVEKIEGGISNLKAIINVKNRSNTALKDITIVDSIPNVADYEKEVNIGTLHPSKVLGHDKKGTIIKWVIDDLDVGEERVISYKIKSKLSILGGFNLPAAVGKVKIKDKEKITNSNSLTVKS